MSLRMMEHSLLKDPEELVKFSSTVLPELVGDEVFLGLVVFRRKWLPEGLRSLVVRGTEFLHQFYIRENSPDYIVGRVIRNTIIIGTYTVRLRSGEEVPVPLEGVAVYLHINPKSMIRGLINLSAELMRSLYRLQTIKDSEGWRAEVEKWRKGDILLFGETARSTSRKLLHIIDIDTKDEGVLEEAVSLVREFGDILWVSETRGGYHIIYRYKKPRSKEEKKRIGEAVRKNKKRLEELGCETLKDPLTPLPGTLQGGFLVRGVKV